MIAKFREELEAHIEARRMRARPIGELAGAAA
jgi:hypothetical protein